jgi:hypothetical protein
MKKLILLCSPVLVLMSCKKDIELKTQLKQPLELAITRTTSISTFDGGAEIPGTEITTYAREKYTPTPKGYTIQRTFHNFTAKGFHQKSMPYELSWHLNLNTEIQDNRIWSVSGFDDFSHKVVESLPVIKRFRDELNNPNYPSIFARLYRNDFDLSHFVEGKFPRYANITNKVLLPNLTQIQIDSVTTNGIETIENNECAVIKVYYKTVSPPWGYLMLEQFKAASKKGKEEFADYTWDSGKTEATLSIWRNLEDGMVWRTSLFEHQTHIAKHKKTQEAKSFIANLNFETLYKTPPKE